jgi:hypothetical protein
MKNLIGLILIILLISCDNTIGSDNVVEINNLEFTIDEQEVTGSILKVKGNVKNLGSSQIASPWYIEGMFYSNEDFTTILGGASQRINFPLESGVSYGWVLSFSSSEINISDYPNFGFRNLRGYRNQ